MTRRALLACAALALTVGCDRLPGRPRAESRPLRPSQVMDFATLYAQNCAGCHGRPGEPGAAVALADPVYLAFADDATLRGFTAQGGPSTAMPAFARSAGGSLTDEQIEVLVTGLRARFARPDALRGATPPPYSTAPGAAARGALVYAARCAECHGPTGAGGKRGGSIVDGSYLGLVSDQGLRTTVVVGRPALGMPDWRGESGDRPLSADEVSDVVGWLIAHRPEFPGQPYPTRAARGHDDG